MNDETFSIKKCPNCNGYGTVSFGKYICVACKGKGIVVIDNLTGKLVVDDDGNQNGSNN